MGIHRLSVCLPTPCARDVLSWMVRMAATQSSGAAHGLPMLSLRAVGGGHEWCAGWAVAIHNRTRHNNLITLRNGFRPQQQHARRCSQGYRRQQRQSHQQFTVTLASVNSADILADAMAASPGSVLATATSPGGSPIAGSAINEGSLVSVGQGMQVTVMGCHL